MPDATCSHEDCDGAVRSLGLCRKHYRQLRLARARGEAPAAATKAPRVLTGRKRGSLVTRTELDRDGVKVRVYHRAGTIQDRANERFSWTHPYAERESCEACKLGLIPAAVLDGTYKEARS